MHFCKAKIAIGGDIRNVMNRTEFNPVSWPEVEVLRVVHGTAFVDEVEPFVSVPQKPRDERVRLALIYGDEPLGAIWGGMNAPNEMEAPRAALKEGVVWFNQLTGRAEITGKDGKGSNPLPPPVLVPDAEISPAVEIVGQPIAAPVTDENDPYSEYEQADTPKEPKIPLARK
jgi:hypothetical protein